LYSAHPPRDAHYALPHPVCQPMPIPYVCTPIIQRFDIRKLFVFRAQVPAGMHNRLECQAS